MKGFLDRMPPPSPRPLRAAEHRPPPPPPDKPKRKIVQITATAGDKAEGELFALCDDGTTWQLNYSGQWCQLPAIPQPISNCSRECDARQAADAMICTTCRIQWDINDPRPPQCRKNKG